MPTLRVAGSRPLIRATAARTVSTPGAKLVALLISVAALLLPAAASAQGTATNEIEPVTVLSFKWSKDRRPAELADDSAAMTPQPAMNGANKNFERQRRSNDPAGVRDPNADTLDGRSAELDRITAESRETKPEADGFTYQAKIQNKSAKVVTAVFWEYQFKEKN